MRWLVLAGLGAAPLASLVGARRCGVPLVPAVGVALGALALAALGTYAAVLYDYAVVIEGGLCGEAVSFAPPAAAAVGYAVVGSWAALRPGRVWAWSGAPLAAAALWALAAYVDPGAHGHCET